MVKIIVVDTLGIMIGEIEETADAVVVQRPLAFAPSQTGIALQENPLYGEYLHLNKGYVIARSEPNENLKSQYEAYAIKKRSGIVTPGSPEMKTPPKLSL